MNTSFLSRKSFDSEVFRTPMIFTCFKLFTISVQSVGLPNFRLARPTRIHLIEILIKIFGDSSKCSQNEEPDDRQLTQTNELRNKMNL